MAVQQRAVAKALVCFVLLGLSCTTMGNTEVDALHALRQALVDPFQVLQTWDPSLVNPCTWFHVTCDSDNSVIRVDLGNAALSGRLVPELGELTYLQYLEMYGNNISGAIPFELGNLTNLVSLDLYQNQFIGTIPASLGSCSKLEFLRLNNNILSGEIPETLTQLEYLEILDLSYNDLVGPIPTNGSFSLFSPLSFEGNPGLYYPDAPPPSPQHVAPESGC